MRTPLRLTLTFVLTHIVPLCSPAHTAAQGCTTCTGNPTPMQYGDCITCTLAIPGDSKTFSFHGDPGDQVFLQATQMSVIQPCIRLIGPSIDASACNCANTNQIGTTLSLAGTYTVVVTDKSDFGSSACETPQAGDFILALERLFPPSPSATSIPYGTSHLDSIDVKGETDLYWFVGHANDRVFIQISQISGIQPCIKLSGPGTNVDACACAVTNQIDQVLPSFGMYSVLVTDKWDGGSSSCSSPETGKYGISLQCLSGDCSGHTVTVPGNQTWVDSGIAYAAGDVVSLHAAGAWKPDPALPSLGAVGRAEPCGGGCPINANHGALLGRIGDNPPFFVGNGIRFVVNAAWSGNLRLQINDNVLADNSGAMTVLVLPRALVSVSSPGGAQELGLRANTPNPFTEATTIQFAVPEKSNASLLIYDVAGRVARTLLSNTPLEAGEHVARWDGRGDDGQRSAPGVYFYRLELGGRQQTQRAILLK